MTNPEDTRDLPFIALLSPHDKKLRGAFAVARLELAELVNALRDSAEVFDRIRNLAVLVLHAREARWPWSSFCNGFESSSLLRRRIVLPAIDGVEPKMQDQLPKDT